MLLITLRDLQFRAFRFAVVILATALVFTMLLLMTGLSDQFEREPRTTVALFGADRWILRDGASGAFTSAATLDARVVDQLETTGAVDPLILARHSMRIGDADPEDIVVVGVSPGGMATPDVVAGHAADSAHEVVVGDNGEVQPGDSIVIGATSYRVTGTTPNATMFAGMPLVFMSLEDAQELLYRGENLATALLVRDEVAALAPDLQSMPNEAIIEDAMRPLERSISSINLIRALLWVVAAMIIGAVVYLSALERQRDFAVLKAVGGSNRGLLGGLAMQGVLIAAVAGVVAVGLQYLLVPVFPLDVYVATSTLVQLPLVAVGVALVASLAGLKRVARADPVAAFGGPGT